MCSDFNRIDICMKTINDFYSTYIKLVEQVQISYVHKEVRLVAIPAIFPPAS